MRHPLVSLVVYTTQCPSMGTEKYETPINCSFFMPVFVFVKLVAKALQIYYIQLQETLSLPG